MERQDRNKLREILNHHFDASELQGLCYYELNIDYEALPGQSKPEKIRALIAYTERHGRSAELVNMVKRLRPHVNWASETVPETSGSERRPMTGTHDPGKKPWVQITVALIGAAATIIAALVGLNQCRGNNDGASEPFSYQVEVLDATTDEAIAGAHVTIMVGGDIAPIDDYADSEGFVILSIDDSRTGKLGKVSVEKDGYKSYLKSINLNKDALPKTIKLEPSP